MFADRVPGHAARGATRPPVGCRICGGPAAESFDLREMLFGTRERFEYRRCAACGGLQIRDIPADLGRYYPPDYYDGVLPEPRTLGRAARLADRWRNASVLFGRGEWLARATRHWRPSRDRALTSAARLARGAGLRSFRDPILDVGCGRVPVRLASLRALGFTNLIGIDPFLDADAEVGGIPLQRRDVGTMDGTFRVVLFDHSFEHVPDPAATLEAAARLIGSDGSVVIRTPIMGSWFWDTYGRDWWELDPPRHLHVFTTAGLASLAAGAGLTIAETSFDSTEVEIIASEQFARDIAWREPGSWAIDGAESVDAATSARYRATVDRLNRDGRAGRAAFFLRPRPTSANAGARPFMRSDR